MFDKLVSRIERTEQLDRLGDAVRPVIRAAVGSGRRLDVLTGRWLGHPTHPAVVLAPMACWISTTVLDAIGGPGSRRSAERLLGAGIVSAAPAAASGSADWLTISGAEQRVGTVHALVNNTALALYTGSLLARRRGLHGRGVALSGAATALLGLGGFLGGHLAYRRGVGVDTTTFLGGPQDWTGLELHGPIVPGEPLEASAGPVPMVAVIDGAGPAGHNTAAANGTSVDGDDGPSVQVLEGRCTHRGGPLYEGDVDDGCITCPWHGSRFELATGAIRRGPASAPQPVYDVRRAGDRISEGSGLEIRRREEGSLRKNPVLAAD